MPSSANNTYYWDDIVEIIENTNFVTNRDIILIGYRRSRTDTSIHLLHYDENEHDIMEFKDILADSFEDANIDTRIIMPISHVSSGKSIIKRACLDFDGVKSVVMHYSTGSVSYR